MTSLFTITATSSYPFTATSTATSASSPIEFDQKFRNSQTKSQKREIVRNLYSKYPEKIPVIIEAHKDIRLDKVKYLVPFDLLVHQFFYVIRKRLNFDETTSLFMFTENNIILKGSDSLGYIYNKYKNEDGFLYFKIVKEKSYG